MADRPPPKPMPKELLQTIVMPDAPRAPVTKPVPPAQGSPVKPPAMWNYEGKQGSPPGSPAPDAALARGSSDAPAVPGAAAKDATQAAAEALDPKEELEEMLAIIEASAAYDELSEQIAALEDLVSRLPE